MRVNVRLNRTAISRLQQAQKQSLEMTAEAVKSDIVTSAVVPKNTGELERSGFVDNSRLNLGEVTLVYDTPYARRLYWHPEFRFRVDRNANAQGKWMQSYIDGNKKGFAKNVFIQFYRRLTGGFVR